MNKEDILNKLSRSNVYLMGDSEEVEKYIIKYNDKIQIKAFLSDLKSEVVLQRFSGHNIETELYNDVVLKECFVVICSRFDFSKWSTYLELMDLVEYENFISGILLNSIILKKKLITIMGSKFLYQIVSVMSEYESFSSDYEWHWFRDSDFWTDNKKEYFHVVRMADVIFEAASDKEDNKLYKISKSNLKKDIPKITISDYGFFVHFPQLVKNREMTNNMFLRERERYVDMYYDGLLGAINDIYVEQCIHTLDAIACKDTLLREDYLSNSEVKQLCDDEIKRWESYEKHDKNDVVFTDYLKNNYDKSELMYNPNEAGIGLVLCGVKQIFDILGYTWDNIPVDYLKQKLTENRESDYLIYPCVENALGIKEFREKLKVKTYKGIKYFEPDEYLQYISEYYIKVSEFCEFTGLKYANEKKLNNLTSFEQYKAMYKDAKKKYKGGFSNIYYLPEHIKRYIELGRIEFMENNTGLFLAVDEGEYYKLSLISINPNDYQLPYFNKPVLFKNVYKKFCDNEYYENITDWLKRQGFKKKSTFVQIVGNSGEMVKKLSFVEKMKKSFENKGFYIGVPTLDMLPEIDKLIYSSDFLDNYQFEYRSEEERKKLIEDGCYIVVVDNNKKVCGVSLAEITNGIADGLEIAVAPEYKMHGIAPILSYERYKWLQEKKVEVIRAYVRTDNERSKRYHANLGFEYKDMYVDYWMKF